MGHSKRLEGFTLLEAMIALVIVALGMMAVSTQLNRYVVSATYIEQKTLASWIASNVLTEMSVSPQWPGIGRTEGTEDFAQRQWEWQAEVSETPVENLRRVDVTVALADNPELEIHAMSAFLEPPPPQGFPAVNWLSVGPGAGFGSGNQGMGRGIDGNANDGAGAEPTGMGAGGMGEGG
jgi:general secretion pathway protein I